MPKSQPSLSKVYSPEFFIDIARGSLASARVVAPIVLEYTGVRSVVDVGCGAGTWLSAFQELGIEDFKGYDGGAKTASLMIPQDRFETHDLTLPITVNRKFDLAICLEVAEHVELRYAQTLVTSLVSLAPLVLFSAAIPGQGGNHHVNEQWQEYWADHFAQAGYVAIDCIRPRIWNTVSVSIWYAQNMLLYADRRHLDQYPRLASELSCERPLNLVHPRMFVSKLECPAAWVDPVMLTARQILSAVPTVVTRAVARRFRRLFGRRC